MSGAWVLPCELERVVLPLESEKRLSIAQEDPETQRGCWWTQGTFLSDDGLHPIIQSCTLLSETGHEKHACAPSVALAAPKLQLPRPLLQEEAGTFP